MSNTAGVQGGCPAAAERVKVRPTNAAVGHLDVDVCLLPSFWLVFLEDHFALDGLRVEAQPALEFVVGAHRAGVVRVEFILGWLFNTSQVLLFDICPRSESNLNTRQSLEGYCLDC